MTGIIREGHAPDAARLLFPADADEERMRPRRLGRMEHCHGTASRGDHRPIGEADPLVSVLVEESVAGGPVGGLVPPPVGVDLPCDLGRQLIGYAIHRSPRESHTLFIL